jgi:branched-chain amino acid transport system ATP-binding protein
MLPALLGNSTCLHGRGGGRTPSKLDETQPNFTEFLLSEGRRLRIADRGYVIVHGSIAFAGRSADELNNNELIRKFYFGL